MDVAWLIDNKNKKIEGLRLHGLYLQMATYSFECHAASLNLLPRSLVFFFTFIDIEDVGIDALIGWYGKTEAPNAPPT